MHQVQIHIQLVGDTRAYTTHRMWSARVNVFLLLLLVRISHTAYFFFVLLFCNITDVAAMSS